jgi:outer membrane receptor protein involved in Fe transport
MDRRNIGRVMSWALAGTILLAVGMAGPGLAGTTGKLSGRITSKKKEPLAGVNVAVLGMPLGAATDLDGRYTILNIPPGKISVKASLIGYGVVTTQAVEISSDNTTRLDLDLVESAVQMQEVVVSARRAVVEVNRTSNIATVSREQLAAMPVQELQDVVNLQAGVVDGHFRGGREGEVQYQVDGVSVNNAYDNKSTLKLDRSLLEEVQVISGTFDAEYGQAMSGVVNAVLKRGSEKFRWDGEVFSGGYAYSNARRSLPGDDLFHPGYKFRPASQQNYQLSIQGPTKLPKTTYLLSASHLYDENWVYGRHIFDPWVKNDATRGIFHPSGDFEPMRLAYSSQYSGVAKVATRLIPNVELSWQGLFNVIQARAMKWNYAILANSTSKQNTFSVTQGLDLTHTLSPTCFYTLDARQNYFDYTDRAFASVFDPRYDEYGQPLTLVGLHPPLNIQGVDPTRFAQNTNGLVLKGSFVDQLTKEHQLKVGAEWQTPHVKFGAPGYLAYFADSNNVVHLQRITQYSAKYPGEREYRPFIGAAFAQEEVEWNDLTLRGGLRAEYFDARSYTPSDLANPANSIAGVPRSHPVRTTAKVTVAPRLGVSYPISRNASLFFAYGHFYQMPGLGKIFDYSDYDRLADIQAADADIKVMGNPDIRPERTVQYQFGYKHAVNDWLGLDVTAFYKDVRDLLGTQILETYNGAVYARLANVDFGSVTGFTLSITQRTLGRFSSKLDYTWQTAQGNSSDPNETATRASAGQDPRPRSIPFNWDQRHTLNLSGQLSNPDRYELGVLVRISSGQPYTPSLGLGGFSGSVEPNSGRKPNTLIVDLRGDHRVSLGGFPVRGFARVFNLFDTRFDNGTVFEDSGDPYYSSNPAKDQDRLLDPTRFYAPRRIEVGLTLNAGN